MKLHKIAILAVLVFLSSCSKDIRLSEDDNHSIGFRIAFGNLSKATATTVSNIGSFKVTAIGNDDVYFSDLNVNVSASGVCSSAESFFWPGYELGFYAYANPSNGTAMINNSVQKVYGITPVSSAASQTDFVIAYNTGTKSSDMVSGVALNFRHALSQIVVKATNKSTSGLKVYVNGVKVGNIKSSGDFTFPSVVTNTNNGGTLSRSLWDVSGSSLTDYSLCGSSLLLSPTDANMMFSETSWMLVPQQLTAWDLENDKTNTGNGAYLALNVRILDAADNQLYPATESQYAYTYVPIGTEWEPGKRYIYTLNFLDESSHGGAGVDVNGDPVLGNPIRFTLTIDDWDQVPQIEISDLTSGSAIAHDYVDFGLKETIGATEYKVCFAKTNIGAVSETDYGYFFMWGDTELRYDDLSPYSTGNGSFSFSYANMVHHTGSSASTGYTKYIPSSKASYWGGEGAPDNLSVLLPEDDAATAFWGPSWRMPDKGELDLLISSATNQEWVTNYKGSGIAGLLITGKGAYSSASLFLPAGGSLYNQVHYDEGVNSYIWSRTLNSGSPGTARYLYCSDGDVHSDSHRRCSARSVRPVMLLPAE